MDRVYQDNLFRIAPKLHHLSPVAVALTEIGIHAQLAKAPNHEQACCVIPPHVVADAHNERASAQKVTTRSDVSVHSDSSFIVACSTPAISLWPHSPR